MWCLIVSRKDVDYDFLLPRKRDGPKIKKSESFLLFSAPLKLCVPHGYNWVL